MGGGQSKACDGGTNEAGVQWVVLVLECTKQAWEWIESQAGQVSAWPKGKGTVESWTTRHGSGQHCGRAKAASLKHAKKAYIAEYRLLRNSSATPATNIPQAKALLQHRDVCELHTDSKEWEDLSLVLLVGTQASLCC